jgi:hypothetical protein
MVVKSLTRTTKTIRARKGVGKVIEAVKKNNPKWLHLSRPLEPIIKIPVVFAMLGIYQGMFSGNALSVPKRLEKAFNSRIFRALSLFLIALQSTAGDIENAILAVILFQLLLYMVKTDEERKKSGFL